MGYCIERTDPEVIAKFGAHRDSKLHANTLLLWKRESAEIEKNMPYNPDYFDVKGSSIYTTTEIFHKFLDENPEMKSLHIAFQMRGEDK